MHNPVRQSQAHKDAERHDGRGHKEMTDTAASENVLWQIELSSRERRRNMMQNKTDSASLAANLLFFLFPRECVISIGPIHLQPSSAFEGG